MRAAIAVGMIAVLALGACEKRGAPAPLVRPVRVLTVALQPIEMLAEFSGEIKPRIETRLAFRVPGKLVARQVDVGATVRKGQLLASLDAQDLKLAEAGARAQLAAAETDRNLAAADLKRFAELRGKGFISSAELERRESAFKAAQARFDQAQAYASQQRNQAGYATLHADADGVVTAVDAEAGQVVAAGQSIVRIAPQGAKEVLFAIPEDQVEVLRKLGQVEVRTWAQPERALVGRLREISPVADPATRTYQARATLTAAPADVLLGMTASVRMRVRTSGPRISLPLAALVQQGGKTAVWVLDPKTSTVNLVAVTTGAARANDITVTSGLEAGQMVVTAGVHQLQPGQKVSKLADGAIGSAQ